MPLPSHQNVISHIEKPADCNSHGVLGILPLCVLLNVHPDPDTTDCNSKKGIRTIKKNRSVGTVIWRASVLAEALSVFDISQRINSASTAARAIVVEKEIATTRRRPDFAPCSTCDCRKLGGASLGR